MIKISLKIKKNNPFAIVFLGIIFLSTSLTYSKNSSLTLESVRNASYYIPGLERRIKLFEGTYNWQSGKDRFREVHVNLLPNFVAFGRLNHHEIASAILQTNFGGSGVFYSLVAVEVRNGTPYNIASIELGDRVEVKSTWVNSDGIGLNLTTQGPHDPRCCPSLEQTIKYQIVQNKLVQISKEEHFTYVRVGKIKTDKNGNKNYLHIVLEFPNHYQISLMRGFPENQPIPTLGEGSTVRYKPTAAGAILVDSIGKPFNFIMDFSSGGNLTSQKDTVSPPEVKDAAAESERREPEAATTASNVAPSPRINISKTVELDPGNHTFYSLNDNYNEPVTISMTSSFPIDFYVFPNQRSINEYNLGHPFSGDCVSFKTKYFNRTCEVAPGGALGFVNRGYFSTGLGEKALIRFTIQSQNN